MKKIIICTITLVFSLVLLVSCGKKDEANQDKNKENKYIAYYFHPTARCESCLNLEAFLKELIDTKYSKEGFTFTPLNIEEKQNKHHREKYELQFSSVIIENTETKKWKNLDSIWSYTNDKEKFFKYTEKEINQFINN